MTHIPDAANVQAGSSDGRSRSGSRSHGLLYAALLAACAAAMAAWSINAYVSYHAIKAQQASADDVVVQQSGLIVAAPKHLAPTFTDVQGRLLADPPAAPGDILDPATIVVAHWVGSDADSESPSIPWDQFEKQISDATGKPVKDLPFDDSPEQIAQIQKGAITVVALHAADAPFLVNNCGYQPQAVLAEEGAASGNRLDIIVPAGSAFQRPGDLRGHTIACVLPTSITGYRAAIALLMQNQGLRPNVDYKLVWSLKQTASILGVAKGTYEAAAVSDDKLQSLLKAGKLKSSDYREIFHSEVIPRLTIGWFYNLKPELAVKIRSAILSFEPAPAGQDKDANLHFVAADYKKDFGLVRLIDDSFDPRLDAKAARLAKADK